MTKGRKTKKRFMNFQGKIEFTGDGRKNIQQHTFPTKDGGRRSMRQKESEANCWH
jgi:hypothetical protein